MAASQAIKQKKHGDRTHILATRTEICQQKYWEGSFGLKAISLGNRNISFSLTILTIANLILSRLLKLLFFSDL